MAARDKLLVLAHRLEISNSSCLINPELRVRAEEFGDGAQESLVSFQILGAEKRSVNFLSE